MTCYQCGSPASRTCDFQRTVYDVCGRPCCLDHRIDVTGGRCLCTHHHERIEQAAEAYAQQLQLSSPISNEGTAA